MSQYLGETLLESSCLVAYPPTAYNRIPTKCRERCSFMCARPGSVPRLCIRSQTLTARHIAPVVVSTNHHHCATDQTGAKVGSGRYKGWPFAESSLQRVEYVPGRASDPWRCRCVHRLPTPCLPLETARHPARGGSSCCGITRQPLPSHGSKTSMLASVRNLSSQPPNTYNFPCVQRLRMSAGQRAAVNDKKSNNL